MDGIRLDGALPQEQTAMLQPPKGPNVNVTGLSTEGTRARQQKRPKHYRPVVTSSWTLTAFLVALAGCLAFLELARVSELSLSDYIPLSRRDLDFEASYAPSLVRRQLEATSTAVLSTAASSVSTTATYTPTAPGDPPPESLLILASVTPSPSPTQFTTPTLLPTTDTVATGQPAPSALLSLTDFSSTTTYPAYPGSTGPPTPGDPPHGSELKLSATFTNEDYFLAMYLPTLLTVILQSSWTIIYAATKMMEPFYQLAKSGGARAEDSLLADYLSSGLSLNSLQSLFSGHLVMLCTSTVQLLMGVVVTLAGESMTVKPTAFDPETHQPGQPAWFINTAALRTLQALLSVVFVLVFSIIALNWRRKSDLASDPSTIASMASLLGHSSIIEDLNNISPAATKNEVKQALAGKQYKLAHFQDGLGRQQFGIMKTVSSNQPTVTGYTSVSNPATLPDRPGKSRQNLVLLRDVVFLLVILALFGIILAYKFIHGNQPLNVFLNSNGFGPRFILSGVAVLISSGWKRLEREVRVMEPYRRMARRLSPAQTTVLASMTASPFTTAFVAPRRGWYFVSFIAVVTISSEVLLIAIPGVPFSTAQILPAYLASTYVSLAILAVMAIAVIAILIRRSGDPDLPREPDTLALVWLYLCGSNMVGTDIAASESSEKHQSKSYWFGRSLGADGRRRWVVNEDQHGIAVHTR